MRIFAIGEAGFDGLNVNGYDITDLHDILARLRNQWRDDHEVYTVEVMLIFGQLIAEIEKPTGSIFEWEGETSDDPRLLDAPTETIEPLRVTEIPEPLHVGDLVMRRRHMKMNPPVVGRVIESPSDEIIGVRWTEMMRTLERRIDLVQVGEEYAPFAPR